MYNSLLTEINSIEKEQKRLRERLIELNKRKGTLNEQIIENMRKTNTSDFEYQGKKYTLEERKLKVRKSNKQRQQDVLSVLYTTGYNGDDAEDLYNKLTGAFYGPEKTVYKLKR